MQIQPNYLSYEQYAPLFEKEGLFFEVLDLSLYYWEAEDFEKAIDLYRQSNRAKSLHGYFIDINPASSNPVVEAHSKEACRQSCEIARRIGADQIVFHSSCYPNLRGVYMRNWVQKCAKFYSELVEEFNMNIYIENCADHDPEPIKALLKEASNPRIKACLDTGHAFLSCVCIEEWFEELGDDIGYIHLSDNMGQYDEHIPIGDGRIDWKTVDRYCRTLPLGIRSTLEVGGVKEIEKSLRYIKENGLFENL